MSFNLEDEPSLLYDFFNSPDPILPNAVLPPSSSRFQLFGNPVILASILEGVGSRSKRSLAKILRVNKACLEAGVRILYRDVTLIKGYELHTYFSHLGVPHDRWIKYRNAVQEMKIPSLSHLQNLAIPKYISLYPNLSSISFSSAISHGYFLANIPAKLKLIRKSNQSYTCDSLSIECSLSNPTSGDVLSLYGLNRTTGKGWNGIVLTKLEFTGGSDCLCTINEDDLLPSGYSWMFPSGFQNRVLQLGSLGILNLGSRPMSYRQLMNVAEAIPSVTSLTVCCSTYAEDGRYGDNLESLAMKLCNLDTLIFEESQQTSTWSLIKAMTNLIKYCPKLKELQLPIHLRISRSTAESNFPNYLKPPIHYPLDQVFDRSQFSSLRIMVDGNQVGDFHSFRFACLLLRLVSEKCKIEIVEGHNPKDHTSHPGMFAEEIAVERYGSYRSKVTWAGEVMGARDLILEQLGYVDPTISTKKGWRLVGPVDTPTGRGIPLERKEVELDGQVFDELEVMRSKT